MLQSKFIGYIMDCQSMLKYYQFISDSQDTIALKEYFGNNENVIGFDGFFVKIQNGDYISIYGIEGIVPYLNKKLFKIL